MSLSQRRLRQRRSMLGFLVLTLLPLSLGIGCSSGGGGGGSGNLALLSFNLDSINGVFLNERLVFTFSTAVDPASVSNDTIQVRFDASNVDRDGDGNPDNPGNTNATPAGTFTVEGTRVIFDPRLPVRPTNTDTGFVPGISYTVTIPAFPEVTVNSLNGRPMTEGFGATFQTRNDPAFPPGISLTSFDDFFQGDPTIETLTEPTPGADPLNAVDAPVSTDIEVRFSEPILPSTVVDGLFLRAIGPNSGRPTVVSSIISLVQDPTGTRVRFQPTVDLPRGTRVEVVASTSIRDFGQNRLAPPGPISVTTVGGPISESSEFTLEGTLVRPADFSFETNFLEDTDRSGALWDDSVAPGSLVATAGGTGADGSLVLTADFVLDTDEMNLRGVSRQGRFDFTDLVIPADVTLSAVGSHPLRIFVAGVAVIDGTIDIRGEEAEAAGDTAFGGAGGVGGGDGGEGGIGRNLPGLAGEGPGAGGGSEGGEEGDRASGGGGAGYAAVGETGNGIAAALAPGIGGASYGDANLSPDDGLLLAGSGGGGAGFQIATNGSAQSGGGGGGGGGAVQIQTGKDMGFTGGVIDASGGQGGRQVTSSSASGGGGSGGAILLQSAGSIVALVRDEGASVPTSFLAEGGEGGGGNISGKGGQGSVGRIHIETGPRGAFIADPGSTDAISPEPAPSAGGDPILFNGKTSAGISRFLDTQQLFPDYIFDPATDADPAGDSRVCFLFQGAPEDPANPGAPDLANTVPASGFTANIDDLDDLRFIRFAVILKVPVEGAPITEFDDPSLPRANSISLRYQFR